MDCVAFVCKEIMVYNELKEFSGIDSNKGGKTFPNINLARFSKKAIGVN